jgi:hypothetical protein
MKTAKTIAKFVSAALAVSAALYGCDNATSNPDTVVPYGYISAISVINPSEQIPVYMTNGVTDDQAVATIANIQEVYNDYLSDSDKNDLAGKIEVIRIVSGDNSYIISNGNRNITVNIKYSAIPYDIFTYFTYTIIQQVLPTLTQTKMPNAVRLAYARQNASSMARRAAEQELPRQGA